MRPYAHELCHHLLTATAIATIAALALVGAAGGYTTTYPSLSAFQVVNDYSGVRTISSFTRSTNRGRPLREPM